MLTSRWMRCIRLEKGGLRLFWHRDGQVAVADNSGTYPEHTEDGVLWVDTTEPMHICCLSGRPHIRITNSGGYCYTGLGAVAKLKEAFPEGVFTLSVEVREVLNLLNLAVGV